MQPALENPVPEAPAIEQAIIAVLREMPEDRAREVLDFALFLQARIWADDAKWDAAFATTDSIKLKAWLDAERAADDDLQPMFDESGEFVP
jgi:hypothetical protein